MLVAEFDSGWERGGVLDVFEDTQYSWRPFSQIVFLFAIECQEELISISVEVYYEF